jgi:hypothetical protein
MKFAAIYAMVVGCMMIGQWSLSLVKGQVPELKTEPVRILFHIVAEFVTASALIAGGVGLLIGSTWGRALYLLAMGMLLYTLVVSPGYYAQKRVWPFVGMFAVVLIVALISLGLVF